MSQARFQEALRSISNGSVWVGQKIMQRLIAEVHARMNENKAQSQERPGFGSLTSREKQIAGLVAKGKSNLEIAVALKITERTVKAHLTSVYEKTGTGNRLSLALLVNQG
jgi:two-component system, NarL family, nitrate/nitrite response regulator NarL